MKGKFAIGAVIGAVAGVVVGVITAPKAGKETRADIKDKATHLRDGASRKTEELKTQSGDVLGSVREKIDALRDRVGFTDDTRK